MGAHLQEGLAHMSLYAVVKSKRKQLSGYTLTAKFRVNSHIEEVDFITHMPKAYVTPDPLRTRP